MWRQDAATTSYSNYINRPPGMRVRTRRLVAEEQDRDPFAAESPKNSYVFRDVRSKGR
jgi:hypothetical protein